MSHIDEHTSFYNFSLTCKRFYNVTRRVVRDWHDVVKARKLIFYSMKLMTAEYLPLTNSRADHWPGLDELPRHVELYKATKPTLANVLKVWRSRGPVAAELFTWINNVRVIEATDLMQTCRDSAWRTKRKITLLLPRTQKELTFHFFPRASSRESIMMATEFGSEKPCFMCSYQNKAGFYFDWTENEINKVFNCVDSGRLLDIIREELGETNHPITGRNLLWLLFYPESLELEPQSEDLELIFQDPNRNKKPTLESVQPALQRLEQSQSLLLAKGESNNVKEIVKMLKYLENYPKSFLLTILQYLHKVSKQFHHIPHELLMCLMLRTTFCSPKLNLDEDCEPISEERCFSFRISKGKILQGKLLLEGQYDSVHDAYIVWEFELPDGSKTQFDKNEIMYIDYDIIDCDFGVGERIATADGFIEIEEEVAQQILGKIHPVIQFIMDSLEDERIKCISDYVFLHYFWKISTYFCIN